MCRRLLGVREAVAIVAGAKSVQRRTVHRGLGRALRRRRIMRVAVPGACDVGGIASVGGRTWPSVWLRGERRKGARRNAVDEPEIQAEVAG